jgi:hypothetical protein
MRELVLPLEYRNSAGVGHPAFGRIGHYGVFQIYSSLFPDHRRDGVFLRKCQLTVVTPA